MTGDPPIEVEDKTIAAALSILERRLKAGLVCTDPEAVKTFLRLQAQGLHHEIFAVMYLDVQHRLIEYEKLFRGTLAQTAVYPREVVKQALLKNAASVILHHNHPSGCCRPSLCDTDLTSQIREALEIVDIRMMDHVITSDADAFSMLDERIPALTEAAWGIPDSRPAAAPDRTGHERMYASDASWNLPNETQKTVHEAQPPMDKAQRRRPGAKNTKLGRKVEKPRDPKSGGASGQT